LEFKRSTGEIEDALKDIAAILNKSGNGEVYFGIHNNGEVTGQEVAASTLRKVSQAISNHIAPVIYPVVEKVTIDEKNCIKVAFEGVEKPYYCRGRAYIRVGEESKLMAPLKRNELIRAESEYRFHWDSQPSDIGFKDISREAVQSFVEKARSIERLDWRYRSIEDAMRKLKL